MGYYASGEGTLVVRKGQKLTKEEYESLREIGETDSYVDEGVEYISISSANEKYYSDDVNRVLDSLSGKFEEGSSISYVGEDDSYWRFLLTSDGFIEENGTVLYGNELPFTKEEKNIVADALIKLGTDDAAEIIRKYNLIFVGGENNENV